MSKHTDAELKEMLREVLLENIDKIAAAVATKMRAKLVDRSLFVRKEHRLDFVKKYKALCHEAYGENHNNLHLKDYKNGPGKAIVILAREELKYKKTTYSGDIYRMIGISYYKSINKWPY